MPIKSFLRSHPILKCSTIEQILGIPHGTIRLSNDNPIPDKYIKIIEDLLLSLVYQPTSQPVIKINTKEKDIDTHITNSDVATATYATNSNSSLGQWKDMGGRMIFIVDKTLANTTVTIIR